MGMTRLATVGWIEQARIIKPVNSWSVADAKQHCLEFDRARKRPKRKTKRTDRGERGQGGGEKKKKKKKKR